MAAESPAPAGEATATGPKRLRNKTALVTGASRGIGRAIAESLAREGADVALVARDDNQLGEVAREIRKGGVRALVSPCDVTHADQIEKSVRDIDDELGRIDFLINNAGVGLRKPIDEISVEEWDHLFAVNLRGVFLFTKHVVPIMRRNGGGHIVNISSVAGLVGNPGLSAYNASKFGLQGFSEALMLELRHDKIGVTTICPGSTDSSFSGEQGAPGRDLWLSVEDVSHAVVEVLATAPNALISQVHLRPLVPPRRG